MGTERENLKFGGGLVAKSCLTLVTSWIEALQALLSIGFSRQEYSNGLPFPSPGYLPDPRAKTRSPALQADSLPTEPPGKAYSLSWASKNSQQMEHKGLSSKLIYSLNKS